MQIAHTSLDEYIELFRNICTDEIAVVRLFPECYKYDMYLSQIWSTKNNPSSKRHTNPLPRAYPTLAGIIIMNVKCEMAQVIDSNWEETGARTRRSVLVVEDNVKA